MGAYFPIMTGDVLYIIPLITRLLAKTKNFTRCVFTIYLLPIFVVLISREIVRQRRCHLAIEYAGVDKLPDYLRSDTKDVTFLDSGHYMHSNGLEE